MQIALAQTNPIIGDIAGNAEQIRCAIRQAADSGAQLVVFPELAVLGYPPKDLLLKPAVIEQCGEVVEQLAGLCTDIAAIIGYPAPSGSDHGRPLYNSAAFCHGGRIVARHAKTLLPTYDVFDEHRYFEPGPRAQDLIELAGQKLGVTICEDLWNDADFFDRRLYRLEPVQQLVDGGATMIINCSASPYVLDKHAFRQKLFAHTAQRFGVPLLYCNQVGGNDELVFDGNSCAFDATGQLIAQAKDFEPDLLIVELVEQGAKPTSAAGVNRVEVARAGVACVYHALVLGLRDYCRKCGFKSVVLGLSGGIDSAVTAAICAAALGNDNVHGVAMPSRYSSIGSATDAKEVAANLALQFSTIPIDHAHKAFESMLTPQFGDRPPDTAEENVQARIRGIIMMALSNKFGSLLVTTGNKSELAVGYCTLYGDMCGGLAVLSDVPKMMVWELAKWINESDDSPLRKQFGAAVIPQSSITKPPSAELRPDQTDQDSLPPYEVLDQIIERYVEREQSADQIIAETGYDADTVLRVARLIDLNEYKRKQAAPGLKVTGRAFGFGRRMPIAQRYDNSWQAAPAADAPNK